MIIKEPFKWDSEKDDIGGRAKVLEPHNRVLQVQRFSKYRSTGEKRALREKRK